MSTNQPTNRKFWATFRDDDTGLMHTIAVSSNAVEVIWEEARVMGFYSINLHRIEEVY